MLTRSLAGRDLGRARAILDGGGGTRAARAPMPLESAAPGVEASAGGETYWLIRRRLAEVSGDDVAVQKRYAAVVRGAGQRLDELSASAGLCHVANGRPEGPLFMDIETCGLAGSCIFLIGTMAFRRGQLHFEQLLARHYGQEPAILSAFAERLAGAAALVTFNGKSFDMTQIRDRCAFHGVDLPAPPPHCDLLHDARRAWRRSLPNCRLQTLEQYLCNRRRVGDIPGHMIPDAYHRFVADGDAAAIKAICHHNLLDLLTMSQLVCCLLTGQAANVDG